MFKEFETGETAYFNGQKVKLVRLAEIDEGRTWRVKDEHGIMYNVPVDMLHLLSRSPSGDPATK